MATAAEPAATPRPRRAAGAQPAARLQTSRLVTAHIWVPLAAFAIACVLGVWQMWARSPLPAPAHTAANYFRAVTLHGVSSSLLWRPAP